MLQFCRPIPLYGRNSFKINGEIIQPSMRYSQRVTKKRQRNANERSGRCGEKERARERKVEKARKTKKSKRICDLAAARTRPSRLPAADHLSHRRLLRGGSPLPVRSLPPRGEHRRWLWEAPGSRTGGRSEMPPSAMTERSSRNNHPSVRPSVPSGQSCFLRAGIQNFLGLAEIRSGGIDSPLARGTD